MEEYAAYSVSISAMKILFVSNISTNKQEWAANASNVSLAGIESNQYIFFHLEIFDANEISTAEIDTE